MATTYGPYYGTAVNGRQLAVTIIVDQDVASNTSTVREITQLISSNSSATYSDQMLITNTINGAYTVWWQGYASYGAGTHTITDSYRVISHDANGNANATVVTGIQDTTGTFALSVTVTTLTLPNIPRGTTPNLSGGGGFVTGSAKTINLPRASSNYTHDVSYTFGAQTGTIATGAGVTTSWTPPHTLLTEIPNSASGTVDITVVTKQGSTVIGSKKVGFTLTAAASVVPTVSAVAWTEQNPVVASAVGAFVQGQSLIKGTVTAGVAQGSPIVAKSLTIAGSPLSESQVWEPGTSGTISASGQATDARGRTGTKTQNFTVLAYAPPSLSQATVRRATSSAGALGDGTYLRMDLTAAVQSLKPASAEQNALKLYVRTRPVGGSWTVRNNLTHTALTYSNALVMVKDGAAYPLSTSFEVEITITDNIGQYARVTRIVGTGGASFDIAATGTGHGKIWERGGIDVAGHGYVSGNVYSGGTAANDRLTKLSETSNASNLTSGTVPVARLSAASETANGVVERATQAEVDAGTDTTRYVSPKGLRDRAYAPWAMAAGSSHVTASPYTTITFPVGRFTQTPIVDVRVATSGSGQVLVPWPGGQISTTSFNCAALTFAGVWTAANIHWIAVQMTSGNSNG